MLSTLICCLPLAASRSECENGAFKCDDRLHPSRPPLKPTHINACVAHSLSAVIPRTDFLNARTTRTWTDKRTSGHNTNFEAVEGEVLVQDKGEVQEGDL